MTAYANLRHRLRQERHTWLITGVAGFIGSNLLETLLKLGQRVVGLDNFATGFQRNLDEVQSLVSAEQWARFHFLRGDIRNLDDCKQAMSWFSGADGGEGMPARGWPVDFILHQAALGSVPRSVEDPIATNAVNITGFLNMLVAARDAKVQRFVYAASSSTYGDHPGLPKVEDRIGKPLSPYAVTKYVNELYADVFARTYGMHSVGLRYFNVFGPRQDANGAYAAVIPKWIAALLNGETVYINGDGEASRDFCYVDNVVQANLLAATAAWSSAQPQVFNVAVGDRTTLNELFTLLRQDLAARGVDVSSRKVYRESRAGDVRHSQADIGRARQYLGYAWSHCLAQGIAEAMPWYVQQASASTRVIADGPAEDRCR